MPKLLLIAIIAFAAPVWAQAADTLQRLDALYAERHEPEKLKELEKAMDEALEAQPSEYDVLWRAARLKYWLCDGSDHPAAKKRYGKESWNLGEQAVKANAKGVEGHYFAAIGLGCYSQAVGIMTALSEGLEGKFNERLDKAISMDAAYDNAGPLIAKGRYYYELPWPKRDLGKSAASLEKAIKLRPVALRAYLYLAETQLKDGEAKKARETLNKVFSGSEDYDVAEARRAKARARIVKSQIEEELK